MSPEVLVRAVGRAVVGWFFVHSGQAVLRNPAMAAAPLLATLRKRVPALPDDVTLVRFNAAVHVVGGALLATGRVPRLAALVVAGSLVPTTMAGHAYWTVEDPAARRLQKVQFDKNVAVLGGLLIAAGSGG